MTQLLNSGRTTSRVAAQIHEQLVRPQRLVRAIEPPQEAWDQMSGIAARLKLVLARGWFVAGQIVLEDLEYAVRRVQRELDTFHGQLPSAVKPTRLAPPSEIAADLAALGEEFAEVALDLAERSVSVTTEPIELEGNSLGRFRICLYWQQLPQTRAYEVIALEPTPASENDAVTHPHVYDKLLCPGEGALPVQAALAEGRIWDFFTLVKQILQTYNAGSAHVPLDRWTGTACRDCGYIMPSDEHGSCERCDDPLCGECSLICGGCDDRLCSGCASECANCNERFCTGCLTTTADSNRLLCRSCLEQPEDEPHDADDESSADGASAGWKSEPQDEAGTPPSPASSEPVCLGEAGVLT